jgi:hypothetical protein
MDAVSTGAWRQARHSNRLEQMDYKHQVLAIASVPAWRVFAWLKTIEIANQLRPRALLRLLSRADRKKRATLRWYYWIGVRVWLDQVWRYVREAGTEDGATLLEEFWRPADTDRETAMVHDRGVRQRGPRAMPHDMGRR